MDAKFRQKIIRAAMGRDEVDLTTEQVLEVPDELDDLISRIEPIIDEEIREREFPLRVAERLASHRAGK